MKRKVIAFTGVQNSGKDYSASRLMKTMGFKRVAFADVLREMAFRVVNIPFEEGMKQYEELKISPLWNGLNFRNILENLGSAVRQYDVNFFANAVVHVISSCTENISISDLRYPNEYRVIKKYCDENGMDFKLVFCDYHGPNYDDKNPHESAAMANFLKASGYEDQEYVNEHDIELFECLRSVNEK